MNYLKNVFKGVSKPLIFLPFILACVSILMMISTSYKNGINLTDRTVIVQTGAYIIGAVFVVIIANIDYSVFADLEKKLYIGSVIFLLTVYIPGLGVELNGARSWINLGITTFQPSELVKLTFILLFANYLTKHRYNLHTFKDIMKALLYCSPFLAIVLKEDLGSALVFGVVWVVMIFYAGMDGKLFAKCALGVALMVPVAYRFMDEYQRQRIDAFLHPDNLSIAANYQIWQSKTAIGSGGFFGKGLFQGTQKQLEFLPVRNSDFVFSVLVEELGFVGGAALIGLFAWLLYTISKVAQRCKDMTGKLIVIGVLAMFMFQIFENIGMTMSVMPATGITLPFISYGGSSILSNMMAMGLVISVAVQNRGMRFEKKMKRESSNANFDFDEDSSSTDAAF